MSLPGDERGDVQNPLIKYATNVGWEYISPDEALRLRGGLKLYKIKLARHYIS